MPSHELCVEPQVSDIPRLIDWVEACCAADGIAAQIGFRIALALEEAVTNIISHAFDFAVVCDPGIIYQNIHAIPSAESLGNGRGHLTRLRNVAAPGDDFDATFS